MRYRAEPHSWSLDERIGGRILWATVPLLLAIGVHPAIADSVYLKNGRVIRTSSAVIDGDRVVFSQFGHPVSIPLSQVERVVQDDYEDPAPLPLSAVASPPAAAAALPPGAAAAPAPDDPEQSPEYWEARVRAIYAQRTQLEAELAQLRRVERAFLFSHRSTADTRRSIEDVEARLEANEQALPDLRREARRKGVPPGWLRVKGLTSD